MNVAFKRQAPAQAPPAPRNAQYELISDALGFRPTAKDFRRWAPAAVPAAAVARRAALAEGRLMAQAGVLDANLVRARKVIDGPAAGLMMRQRTQQLTAGENAQLAAAEHSPWREVKVTATNNETDDAVVPSDLVSNDLVLSMYSLTDTVQARVLARRKAARANQTIKWAMSLRCTYYHLNFNEPPTYMTASHRCKFAQLPTAVDAAQVLTDYDTGAAQLFTHSEEFTENGSGWTFVRLEELTLILDSYKPLHGASYIDLPRWVKSTKTCINVANTDQLCFGYAIASSKTVRLKPDARDLHRVAKHATALATLDLRGICTAEDAAKCSQVSF
jgi:hypothetical protein